MVSNKVKSHMDDNDDDSQDEIHDCFEKKVDFLQEG